MTGSKHLFIKLDKGKEGSVTFGNDQTARIIGRGTVCLNSKKNLAENVLLIEDMEHNLLSVSQTCDKGRYMIFDSNGCQIRDVKTDKLIGTATRSSSNVYILDEKKNECCLSNENESWLWHKTLGHINFDNLINMSKNEAVRDLPSLKNLSGSVCKQCQHGKQTRVRFKTKEYSTTKPLEIVHTDICGPMRTKGMKGEKYFLLFVDDYTRMTWLYLLKKKSEAFDCFQTFKEFVENECDKKIKCLRSDNGGEYVSNEFNKFCDVNGIKRHFSVTETPQQNGVVERKNRTVVEMARTMLHEAKLSNVLWPQAIHTAVHILNRCLLRNNQSVTPYQMWKGRPANVKHFRIFGCKCYIKRVDPHLGKLDSRTDDGVLVGYSCSIKSYKCYNFRLRKIVEAIDVTFDESTLLKSKTKQKEFQTHDIFDKHRSDDEKDEI